jgi:teichuronic acid biosynthesis glycosyltransferase TuaG
MFSGISVVIPTWNRAGMLRSAVDSVLAQSVPPLEVLICDDGSSDGSQELIEELASQDSRVRWLPGKRRGLPAIARNRGIRESKGEWVAFLDSDDQWLPQKLERQIKALQDSGCRAACTNALRVFPDGSSGGALLDWGRPKLRMSDLLRTNRVVCSSGLLHKSLLERTAGFPEGAEFKAIEDYPLWLRVSAFTDFAYCAEPLVRYRDDPATSIRSDQPLAPHAHKTRVLRDAQQWLQTDFPLHQVLRPLCQVSMALALHRMRMLPG